MTLRARWFSALMMIACTTACERKTCREAGCDAWTRVTYAHPIAGPYDLSVSTKGLTASTRCPQSLNTAQPSGVQGARLGCSEHFFEIAVDKELDGTSRYGDNAPDAEPIEFRVQVTPVADAAAPGSAAPGSAAPGSAAPGSAAVAPAPAPASSGSVRASITSILQPNGPECVPICRSREGRVTLSP